MPRERRRGAALLLALLVVILLEGLAALTLAAATGRLRLVAATRDAVEGRALATHALAEARIGREASYLGLVAGDSVSHAIASPLASWSIRVTGWRIADLLHLHAVATRHASDGSLVAAGGATLILRYRGADTLQVIRDRPRW
jgi:hypothetical protein